MSEKPLPFVITDRRKFTTEGEPRPDAEVPDHAEESQPEPSAAAEPAQPAEPERAGPELTATPSDSEAELPQPPTAEEMEQSRTAFEATADRLDTAIRAANPGADHPPALTFESLVQSVYMQAILQLGGGTREGQQPQIDLLGARQSIDMLGILNEKTKGNLTQALARSAQQRAGAGAPPPPGRSGPSIVR